MTNAEKYLKDKEILTYADVIVDGQYMDKLHTPMLTWRGSSNQRVFKVIRGNYSQELVTLYKLEG